MEYNANCFIKNEGLEKMTSSSNLIDVVSSTTYKTGQHTLQQNSFSNNISTEHNADVYQNNSNLPQSGNEKVTIIYDVIDDKSSTDYQTGQHRLEQTNLLNINFTDHNAIMYQTNSHQSADQQDMSQEGNMYPTDQNIFDHQMNSNYGQKGGNQNVPENYVKMRRRPPKKFVHMGHTFNFYQYNKKKTAAIWRCDKRPGCKVRIHTDVHTNKVVKITNLHNHDSNPEEVKLKQLQAVVKIKAIQSTANPDKIIEISKQKLGIKSKLNEIQKRNFKKIIKRERLLIESTPRLQEPLFVEENINGKTKEETEKMEHFDQYSQQFHQHEYNSHLRNDENFFNDGLQIDNLQNKKPVNVVVESSDMELSKNSEVLRQKRIETIDIDTLIKQNKPTIVVVIEDGPLKEPFKKEPDC